MTNSIAVLLVPQKKALAFRQGLFKLLNNSRD